jgi:hypothetical protein
MNIDSKKIMTSLCSILRKDDIEILLADIEVLFFLMVIDVTIKKII